MNFFSQRYPKYIAIIVVLFSLLNYNVHSQIIITIAGNGSGIYNGESIPSTQAQFLPTAIATDRTGNLYISDLDNSRIRKINLTDTISTVAGNGVSGFSGDSGLATAAKLSYPWGIVLDNLGNLFITDDGESRIRKVTNDGIINTIAGIDIVNGGGYNGDNILAIAARLHHPTCIALDTMGNLYISDQSMRIRKINTEGIINTIAGTGVSGYSGDGGLAVNASIGDPIGIIADKMGNIYFTDVDNNVIRKIDKNGIITTVAGNGLVGYTGDGGSAKRATLNFPAGLAIRNDGTLFIADTYNHAVRRIDTMGIITTIIGDGSPGFSGDDGPAKNAKLNLPAALAFDTMNDLLIADYGNARIRKMTSAPLAVALTLFEVVYYDNKIKINWQTATEINAAYYNVQRSKDGSSFTTIARVDATGHSNNANNYQFIDEEPINSDGNNLYFRLQSIDKNGSSNYIKTVTIKLKNTRLMLYPNPAKDILNVKVSSNKKEMATIQLTDLQGKVLKQLSVQLYVGINSFSINIETLAKGSYTIEIKGAITHYQRFVKS
ncbi:MAG: T9SS type A sorting domain-containing protein [Ferruginibacter sp.]